MKKTIPILAAALALVPAAAEAHVTLQPDEAPAGGFARLDVRVPNERDDSATTKVAVRMPPGFIFASYEPVPGWDVKVAKRRLAKPVESHGARITEEVATIAWTARDRAAAIAPGQFRDFGLSLGIPDRPGRTLTFKALQSYDSGEVVRWIGPPNSEEPAAQVRLTAPAAEARPASATAETDSDDGAPTWLAIVALALGALALLAGMWALASGRR